MKIRSKKNYLFLIFIVLFSISVGYALLNRNLLINGNSEVLKNTWNIYFDNIKVSDGSVDAITNPNIDSSKFLVSFSVRLILPGDFYEFTVDVVNSGTIDGMIESIVKTPNLTDEQKKYMNYIIEYENGEQIISNQLVSSNSFVRVKVRVEYREDITEFDLPSIDQNLDLSFKLNYVQADDNTGINVSYNGVKYVPFTYDDVIEIGTVVIIGTEQFYVIGEEDDNIKLLSMYNLYVGNMYDENVGLLPLENPTGMQSNKAKGFDSEAVLYVGVTVYSNSDFRGEYYYDYNGSLAEFYVNNYKDEISKMGVDVKSARLISIDELTDSNTFACPLNGSCSKKYPWIYSTSYWTGSSLSSAGGVYRIKGGYLSDGGASNSMYYGIRPVIIIPKHLIKYT